MSEFKLLDGRYTVRIRKHLRAFVAAKKQPAVYINELIEKDKEQAPNKPQKIKAMQ